MDNVLFENSKKIFSPKKDLNEEQIIKSFCYAFYINGFSINENVFEKLPEAIKECFEEDKDVQV